MSDGSRYIGAIAHHAKCMLVHACCHQGICHGENWVSISIKRLGCCTTPNPSCDDEPCLQSKPWSEPHLQLLTVAAPQFVFNPHRPPIQSPAAQLVAQLVAEIILCCKEVNTKTRATAFELLVEIGHAMHAARPPPTVPPLDESMGTQSRRV